MSAENTNVSKDDNNDKETKVGNSNPAVSSSPSLQTYQNDNSASPERIFPFHEQSSRSSNNNNNNLTDSSAVSEEPSSPSANRIFNYKFEKPDGRDKKFALSMKFRVAWSLPRKVDLTPEMPVVLDQGSLGSCVSNAASNGLQFCLKKQGASVFVPSRLFIYYHGRLLAGYPLDRDTGLEIRDAGRSISKYHACDEVYWQYLARLFAEKPSSVAYDNANIHTRLSYFKVDQDLPSLKAALADGYPVQIGFMVYSSFVNKTVDKTGIVPMPNPRKERLMGGHSVLLVGYDDDRGVFLFQNSWGTRWGNKGYGTFPYAMIVNPSLAADFWTYRLFG